MVLVIDYGIGNLASFTNALTHISVPFKVSSDARDVAGAERVVLIGVGHFGSAMRELRERGFDRALKEYLMRPDAKLIGVCVGFQMLFEGSEEAPDVPGLGIFAGGARKLTAAAGAPVPHVGFDEVVFNQSPPVAKGLTSGTAFYFTHSFAVMVAPPQCWAAYCRHGASQFVAAVDNGKVAGVQFHPEKSQSNGLALLRNLLTGAGGAPTRGAA